MRRWLVTLSHTDHLAQAVVVAVAPGRRMIPIVTPEEMGAIDGPRPSRSRCSSGGPAAAVARAALDMLGGTYGRGSSCVAGKGNNGNDGRERGAPAAARAACGSR